MRYEDIIHDVMSKSMVYYTGDLVRKSGVKGLPARGSGRSLTWKGSPFSPLDNGRAAQQTRVST